MAVSAGRYPRWHCRRGWVNQLCWRCHRPFSLTASATTLEHSNKELEVTAWLEYFAETVLDAQAYALRLVDFLIAKTRLYDRLVGSLNERQEKVLARMFREGVEGFKGGLSAENYMAITGASPATATRDLADLVVKGALTRTGERRHTRYWLNIEGARRSLG